MSDNISISEIARLANVSVSTVSRAFKPNGKINDETRKTILKIADSLNYRPQRYNTRTQSISEALVGVAVADLSNTFFLDIIQSLTEVLNQHGIHTFICNSKESTQQEIKNLNALRQHVDGIIISPVSETAEYNAKFLMDMEHSSIPVILIDRDISRISLDGVFQNSYSGAFLAVDKLIQNGHKHIAIISGPITSKPGLDRLNGYMDALKHHNIPINQNYILYGDFMEESGRDLAAQILREEPQVTAIFCANNMMAMGALETIYAAGLSVPEDIGFFSYGAVDTLLIKYGHGFSMMDLPSRAMGEECGRMMLERLQNRKSKKYHYPKRITYDARLVLKGSEVYPVNRTGDTP